MRGVEPSASRAGTAPQASRPHAELPLDWRQWGTLQLRAWLRAWMRQQPKDKRLRYIDYKSQAVMVAWIEQHIEAPRCPTCGQPI